MRIELEKLEAGKGVFAHVYQPDEVNPDDERVKLTQPAEVKGNVRLAGNEVFVSGHVETRAQLECDRCLKLVELPVSADFALEYITGADYESSSTAALSEEEMSVSVFDGQSIDVDEIVKEQILLAVPTRTLCREECKGICPECGTDLNTGQCSCATDEVDPRWAALKSFKNTDNLDTE
ncbi:MAG TPA: DUF177 domain-containing protein [Pyrinomonadaceae bacterium]|nr:DUF177 domain-containing protein [Pyrinomonadaceae bacterium]